MGVSRFPGPIFSGGAPLSNGLDMLAAGNIYYVMQSTNSLYNAFCDTHLTEYPDGTLSVYSTIQGALDACTANRNDYVIVMPDSSDYDITAALTMSKARTHLIGAGGTGWGGFQGNMVRVHQNTASTAFITVSADTVEIAGFFFKDDGTAKGDGITLSSTRWCQWIHDNTFAMAATASTNNTGIAGTGACSHFVIERNYFTNYSPGLNTGTNNNITAFIGLTSGSSTRGIIQDNIFVAGVNTTVATAINIAGTGMIVRNNHFHANTANGGNDAGVLTLGISAGVDVALIRNTFTGMNEAATISGATADSNCVLNYDGYNGGTAVDQDTSDH